jgi:hypothetical protein
MDSELKHRINLLIGDWSGDGHEKTSEIPIQSNMAADEIREAYLKGAIALGVNLEEEVCCDYEDDYLPIEIYRIFESAGFGVSEWSLGWMGKPLSDRDRKKIEDCIAKDDNICLEDGTFAGLYLFTAKIGNPDFRYEVAERKDLCIGGYGLFS